MWTLSAEQVQKLSFQTSPYLEMEKKSNRKSILNEAMQIFRDETAFVKPARASPLKAGKRLRGEESEKKEMVHKVAKHLLQRKQKPHSSSSSSSSLDFTTCRSASQELALPSDLEPVRQAQRLGQQVRNLVILPSQIMPALQAYFPKQEMPLKRVEQLAQVICREINQITLPEQTTCTSLRLAKKANTHVFPILGASNISKKISRYTEYEELFLGYDCWLEMSPDGKECRVLLIELDKDGLLGKGTYKEVYRAHNIEIGLTAQPGKIAISTRSVSITPAVFMHTVLEEVDEEADEEDDEAAKREETITHGLKIQSILLDKIPETKVNLVTLPKARIGAELFTPQMERRQEWYNGDLRKAMKEKKLPLSIHRNSPKAAITLKQCLKVLRDVTSTLGEMHALGIVHMDLKPDNMLIKLKDGEACGFLGDFDMSQEIGFATICDYVYWDKLGKKGVATPFSDYYGLAICVAQVLLGKLGKDVRDMMEEVLKIYKNPKKLKEWEKNLHAECFKEAVLKAADLIDDLITKQALLSARAHRNRTIHTQTSAQILEGIQAFLSRTDLQLADQPRSILQRLKTDISLVTMACQLVIKAVQRSDQVNDYFIKLKQTDRAAYKILCQNPPENAQTAERAMMARKLQIIDSCSKALGGYTIKHIQNEIDAILKVLEGKEAM